MNNYKFLRIAAIIIVCVSVFVEVPLIAFAFKNKWGLTFSNELYFAVIFLFSGLSKLAIRSKKINSCWMYYIIIFVSQICVFYPLLFS